MLEVYSGLQKFRDDRNLNNMEYYVEVQMGNILSECAEYLHAKCEYEKVDALCDISVFALNALSYLEDNPMIKLPFPQLIVGSPFVTIIRLTVDMYEYDNKRVLHDILTYCVRLTQELGFNYELCMLETIKEISSRKQDPAQAYKWYVHGVSGKWQKDRGQDPKTLYVADYSKCRV